MQVEEIDRVIARMDVGFGKIHERLDTIVEQTQIRQMACMTRFNVIESGIAVKQAVNGVSEKDKAKKVELQSWLVRATLMAVIIGIGTILWKIFLGNLNLVVQ